MKKKGWIWVIVGIVIIIIIIVIYKSAKSKADKELERANKMEEEYDDTDPSLTNSKKECRQLCRTICKKKSFFGAGRNKCKKTCKADCAVHDLNYVKANAGKY